MQHHRKRALAVLAGLMLMASIGGLTSAVVAAPDDGAPAKTEGPRARFPERHPKPERPADEDGGGTPRAALSAPVRAFEVITNTYAVDSNGDAPNADPTSTVCDTDAAADAGECTLRAAVQAANADPETTDRIVIPAMTITLSNGQIDIESDLLINGAGAANTIVDANGLSRIFDLDSSENDAMADVTDLTLTGGATESNGGAIYTGDTSGLTLTGVTMTENSASDGGAIYVESDASLWLDRTTVTANSANDGGGLYIDGAAYIVDSVIGGDTDEAGNVADSGEGGGIDASGTVTMVDTVVRNNEVRGGYAEGGGIYNENTLSITGGSVSENRLVSTGSSYGAGISNEEQLLVSGTTIADNTASGTYVEGVGVFADYLTTLVDSTVSGNVGTATCRGCDVYGAGISNEYTLSVQGGTISGNRGQGLGSQSFGDGVTNGTTTFESDAANFVSADVGKGITGDGIPSGTEIAGYTDENTVTLSAPAGTADTVTTGVDFTIVDRIDAYAIGGGIYNNYTANISGVTIEGNSVDTTDKERNYAEGGGVANEWSMSLTDSMVRNNTARGEDVYGAGVYSDEELTISDVSVTGSVADAAEYVEGAAIDNEAYMKIVNVTVDDTTAISGGDIYGGAVYHYDEEEEAWDGLHISDTASSASDYIEGGALATEYEILLSNSSITNTTSTITEDDGSIDGGAWYLYYGGVVTNVQVLNTTVSAPGDGGEVEGGAIYQDDDTVYRNLTVDNTAVAAGDSVEGGGLLTYYPFTMSDSSITRSVVTTSEDESDIEGAGVYIGDAPTSLVNVTIADNSATAGGEGSEAEGGGIYTDYNVTLTHVTVAGNSANGFTAIADNDPETEGDQPVPANDDNAGGGIYASDDVTLRGSIVAANAPADSNCATGIVVDANYFHSAGYNLESGDTCDFDTVGDLVDSDPGLGTLTAAGSTFVRPLLAASAAIDAASTNGCPAADQRGVARPVGDSCDIGAFEFVAAAVVPPGPTPTPPATPTGDVTTYSPGYRMVAADGGIFTFGERVFHGSTGSLVLNKPIVGGATDASDNDGYWSVASDGGVFTFNAPFFGSLGDQKLSSPAVEIEPTPTGQGYWIVLADGKVYTFGDANHFGDMGGKALNKPVIGMSVTPTGKGYWLVAEDGGIFNFGDAGFFGSAGGMVLNAPIIDLAPAADNNGYYLLGRDGGVFTFGSAEFKGSTGDLVLNAPVIAMLVVPNGAGYWLAASDGGVFTFGTVTFLGSMGGTPLNSPVLDLIH